MGRWPWRLIKLIHLADVTGSGERHLNKKPPAGKWNGDILNGGVGKGVLTARLAVYLFHRKLSQIEQRPDGDEISQTCSLPLCMELS